MQQHLLLRQRFDVLLKILSLEALFPRLSLDTAVSLSTARASQQPPRRALDSSLHVTNHGTDLDKLWISTSNGTARHGSVNTLVPVLTCKAYIFGQFGHRSGLIWVMGMVGGPFGGCIFGTASRALGAPLLGFCFLAPRGVCWSRWLPLAGAWVHSPIGTRYSRGSPLCM